MGEPMTIEAAKKFLRELYKKYPITQVVELPHGTGFEVKFKCDREKGKNGFPGKIIKAYGPYGTSHIRCNWPKVAA